jgi:urease accessory protein UreF
MTYNQHDAPQGPTITEADEELAKWFSRRMGGGYTTTAAKLLARHREAAERATIEKVVAEMRDAIEAGYPAPERKVDQCSHSKFGWEDCIACYDDALSARLDAIERGEWK